MGAEDKRLGQENVAEVQAGNREWWTRQTMSYDWKVQAETEKFSFDWYDDIDRRFVSGARLFAHDAIPFDKIIPFQQLEGKPVLEIGCGMGLHAELMTRAGAAVTAIDISQTSVDATRRRLELKGLSASVLQMDACELAFPDESFDFVWSWGVIHHSARTGLVIKEIHRVLKPGGETRAMVYNLEGMAAYTTITRDYLFGFWRGKTLDQCLWSRSDGYMARYYTKDILSDVFRIFFDDVSAETYGQDADAIPLPGYFRRPILRFISGPKLRRMANLRGSSLFVRRRPLLSHPRICQIDEAILLSPYFPLQPSSSLSYSSCPLARGKRKCGTAEQATSSSMTPKSGYRLSDSGFCVRGLQAPAAFLSSVNGDDALL